MCVYVFEYRHTSFTFPSTLKARIRKQQTSSLCVCVCVCVYIRIAACAFMSAVSAYSLQAQCMVRTVSPPLAGRVAMTEGLVSATKIRFLSEDGEITTALQLKKFTFQIITYFMSLNYRKIHSVILYIISILNGSILP